jgi:hypothetical protein
VCAGVIPAPGAPVEVTLDVSNIPFCHRPTSNGRGTAVVLGLGLHHLSFTVRGMQGGGTLGSIQVDHQDTGPIFDAIVPTSIGFHAATGTGVESVADRGVFTAYDESGTALATSPVHVGVPDGTPTGTAELLGDVRLLKPDAATGGSVLLTLSGPLFSPTYRVEKVDVGGHRTGGAALDRVASDLAAAADGHMLVLAGGEARWFDASLAPLTEWFPLGFTAPTAPFSRTVLLPLVGGDVALRDGATWKALFRNGAAAVSPPPDWLVSRPGTEVVVVRGGRMNALVGAPTEGYAGGGTNVEFLTPAGLSCGSISLPAGPGAVQVDVGADGTAFTFAVGTSATPDHQLCTYRWWPALLR